MDAQEGYPAEQVVFHRQPVIYIHEFARHEPACDCSGTHPGMRQSQKITVEASKSVDMSPARGPNRNSEPAFVIGVKMMVPHIGRITDNEVELVGFGFRRFRSSKVLNPYY